MTGTKDYSLSREQIDAIIRFLAEDGTILYQDERYKSPDVDFTLKSLDGLEERRLTQLFCVNPSFSSQKMHLKFVDNKYDGIIYTPNRNFRDGFFTLLVWLDGKEGHLSVGVNSWFGDGKGEFFERSQELMDYYRTLCGVIRSESAKFVRRKKREARDASKPR